MRIEVKMISKIKLEDIKLGGLFMLKTKNDGHLFIKTDGMTYGQHICFSVGEGTESWFPPETEVHRVSKITVEVEE